MAKKGTPEYEIWRAKYLQKRELLKKADTFENSSFVSKLKKKLTDSLIEENDLIMFMFLSKVEPTTLSVAALQVVKTKFELEQEDFDNLVSFFKTLSKDILKLRLIGVNNFYKINQKSESYPLDFQAKYSKDAFKERYGYDLATISKVYTL